MTDKEIELAKLVMDAVRVINEIALHTNDMNVANAGNTLLKRLDGLVTYQ